MKNKFLSLLLLGLTLLPQSSLACTLYAAQGNIVEGGGALITKNRDFKPQPQSLKMMKTDKYAYYGLFSGENRERQVVKAGVNEKGLAAVTAMASCMPSKMRLSMPSKPVVRKVLAECATVEEALLRTDCFEGPKYLMLADAKEIAVVEIGENGEHTVQRTSNAYLTHTNFYLEDNFQYLNIRVKESPIYRYDRINKLMEDGAPFTLEKFKEYSQDAVDGPDNSLWRVGSRPDISQTLASFIVRILPNGDFKVWVKYRPEIEDAGQEQIVELDKKQIFG